MMADHAERVICQGDIFWLQHDSAEGEDARIPHPHVVIHEDVLNREQLGTVVVCALTSNLKRVSIPGNILLETGEANLPRQSVVEVAKVSSVEKAALGEYIGTLSAERLAQIAAGRRFVERSFLG